MSYRVILSPAAVRQLGRLRGINQVALSGVIRALADEPRPPGAVRLTGLRNVWRVRVRVDGKPWRVIYRLDEAQREIVVARVVRRDEGTYRSVR